MSLTWSDRPQSPLSALLRLREDACASAMSGRTSCVNRVSLEPSLDKTGGMDAGLAAVLGALVGAVGASSAAAITALLSRSQIRMQIEAESKRVLMEPRRNAYTAYAEGHKKVYGHISKAAVQVCISVNKQGDAYQECLQRAEESLRAAADEEDRLDHRQAVVYIEGPKFVTDACIAAGKALTLYRAEVFYEVDAMPNRTPSPENIQKIEKAGDEAFDLYLKYLYAASDALGSDLLGSGGSGI